ncbi:FG-GAP-like repeat-containing protein [Streptomyces sp. XD-27]|uniref:FG-GAP-like repeat-containing protein n=1 Tax=Streptomyces sp. XD-27 TaxID=3062779 RepID=UPI0026F42EDE|nr:FG-GAP-like repeat-containing protein [Streptomyces sp. XD-27]WKX69193.1 FG-GAP-like repeat-containing protein [Streptomyces sp. XD-27]
MRTLRIRRMALSAVCVSLMTVGAAGAAAAATPTPEPAPTTVPTTVPTAAPAKPGAPESPAAETARAVDGDDWTVEEAIRFWTPERIASATDPGAFARSRTRAPAPGGKPRQGITHKNSSHFRGIKSVGVLFTKDSSGPKTHSCSASVVESKGRNLILTAGHCVKSKAIFIPYYDGSKDVAHQPLGIWTVDKWFVDRSYSPPNTKARESDLDFAFARVDQNGGKNLQDVVGGGNKLARTQGAKNRVTVIGYPMVKHNPTDQAVRCTTDTGALPGYNQMRIDCAGLWGGVSGSPWFSSVDLDRGTGTIIGNVGGSYGGGPDVKGDNPLYNRLTYSPFHADRFFQLFDDAQKDGGTDHGPYRQPTLPYSVGRADTWKHAKLMAAGDFNGTGRSDLVVVWTDGEVTLYNSDGKGDFSSERRLTPKNTTWPHAQTITAGDFGGGNQFDLMVVWSDGEVTLYQDIGAKGLGSETKMPGKKTTWSHATQIAAGRFNAARYVTDLVVRWSDGELTLYTNVGPGTFGQEHKLKDENATWKKAKLLTSGEYSGNAKWDLMVSWTDGELDNYVGTSTSGLGKEHRILEPNKTWEHNTVMTTGNFTPNGRTDDLLIRWSDGETTMYNDTGAGRLGKENTLVYPVV